MGASWTWTWENQIKCGFPCQFSRSTISRLFKKKSTRFLRSHHTVTHDTLFVYLLLRSRFFTGNRRIRFPENPDRLLEVSALSWKPRDSAVPHFARILESPSWITIYESNEVKSSCRFSAAEKKREQQLRLFSYVYDFLADRGQVKLAKVKLWHDFRQVSGKTYSKAELKSKAIEGLGISSVFLKSLESDLQTFLSGFALDSVVQRFKVNLQPVSALNWELKKEWWQSISWRYFTSNQKQSKVSSLSKLLQLISKSKWQKQC